MKYFTFFFSLLILSNPALAESHFGAGGLGTSDGVNSIASLIVNAGYTIGLALFINGLISIYKRGEQPQQYPIGFCVSNIISGTLLLISSTAYSWTVNSATGGTLVDNGALLSIGDKVKESGMSGSSGGFLSDFIPPEAMATLMGFIFLAGLVSFIRGLYLVKDVGKMDNQQSGGFYKALWHMIGGAACMNIVQVSCFISSLLGIGILCIGG